MTKTSRAQYKLEFKQEAVRLVQAGQNIAAAPRTLGVVEQTLYNCLKAQRLGELTGLDSKPVSAAQMEISRLKAELASWVYSARGGNFAKTMLRLAQERETLNVINDQFGAPTGAEMLADVTAHVISQVMAQGQRLAEHAGIYHPTASGETTWFGYEQYVVAQSMRARVAPEIIVKAILPVATSAFPTVAQRPHNSHMNTAKLQQIFGLHLAPWQQGVASMLVETSELKP